MIPPSGFKSQLYPLQHKLEHSLGLSIKTSTQNSAMCTLIRHTNDVIANTPKIIVVNPHNTLYVNDAGPACAKMSIIDKLRLSIKINATSAAFTTDNLTSIKMLWRPIFFSFPEKLDAADDDTGTTVKAILNLTSDATFEDVVPLSANKLPTAGASNKTIPVSTVNIAEVFGDYNLTTDLTTEAIAHDETLFQDAIMRFTNKGALKACVGRTRHVNLTPHKPVARFYFDKFVPKSVRRIMPFSFFAIMTHVPLESDIGQVYNSSNTTSALAHVGVKIICKYDEWNADHFQDMTGAAPVPA